MLECLLWNCPPVYAERLNTLRPRQNGRHFADDIFKCIFLNENAWISIKISLKFVPQGPINNIPALVQIMAWRRSGDKPLSEPMMVSLPMHICVTRPQWVKVMNRCSQTTSHYMSQCWPRSSMLYIIIKSQWVKDNFFSIVYDEIWYRLSFSANERIHYVMPSLISWDHSQTIILPRYAN